MLAVPSLVFNFFAEVAQDLTGTGTGSGTGTGTGIGTGTGVGTRVNGRARVVHNYTGNLRFSYVFGCQLPSR